MIFQRNLLASYIHSKTALPPMLRNPNHCGRCYEKTSCFTYHKLIEDGNGETSGLKEKFENLVRHLKPAHREFFRKWDSLITKEEADMTKFKRELWTMLSREREKLGRCFANVIIEPGSVHEESGGSKINRFKYTFIKRTSPIGFSFADSQLAIGEPVVVSDEEGHFALANGFVTSVSKKRITVAVDRRLHNARTRTLDFHPTTNQSFIGIMDISKGSNDNRSPPRSDDYPSLYRLDKDEYKHGMASVRNNLVQLMAGDAYRAHELRQMIIEGVPPRFKAIVTGEISSGSLSQWSINTDQESAIEKVMSAKDYALVLGMPGTGKTTTIAHIIRALVAQGKSVLLTSYTHTAVDNILLKIRNDDILILRLGKIPKIHPEVRQFAILAEEPRDSLEALERAYHDPPVVATTCLGTNHALFNARVFDYCIVDEASQITLPVCLGPIRMAKTFVLVGDHYQLPPLVQNNEAREGGLDISLFKMLSDRHPTSVAVLKHQYRMCKEIMTLSNTLIYDGALVCGDEQVADSMLGIPAFEEGLQKHHHAAPLSLSMCSGPAEGACWLYTLLDPNRKVVFANTDELLPASREESRGDRITNHIEAVLATQLLQTLIGSGVPVQDIGIITLYRHQLALLRQMTKHLSNCSEVEMNSVDKYQGRDKDVVILSLVRSNEAQFVGDLLKDWRRVNVAFTRARTKLIILGSRSTLMGDELMRRFLALVDGEKWAMDLPNGATEGHVFDEGWTQQTQRTPAKKSDAGSSPYKSGGGAHRERTRGRAKADRDALRESGAAAGNRLKVPKKVGRFGEQAMLKGRAVLRDVVSEVLGELRGLT